MQSNLRLQIAEKSLSELSDQLSKNNLHHIDNKVIEQSIADMKILSDEQADLVRHLCSAGSLKIGEGAAGSGKSTSTQAAANTFKNSGYKVTGLAASWNASNILSHDAKIDAVAIAGFLNKVESGEITLSKKDVLIVDEAGLIGAKDAQKLVSICEKAGSKIIFLGEEKQLNPVSAGPALSIMMEKAGAQSIETIRRQKSELQRQMVSDFRSGKIDSALTILESERALTYHKSHRSTLKAMVNDWADYTYQNQDKSTLILAVKNKDVRELNSMVRDVLRKRDLIKGEDFTIKTPSSNNSLKDLKIAIGDKIILKKNDDALGVKNKDAAEITNISVKNDSLVITAKLQSGREIKIDSSQYTDIETGGVAITHGYAVTQWSSQGATVDKSFVLSSDMDRRYAYVGMSRHRDTANLYVDESSLTLSEDDSLSKKEKIKIALATQLSRKTDKFSTLDFQDDRIAKKLKDEKKSTKEMINRIIDEAKSKPNQLSKSVAELKKQTDLLAEKINHIKQNRDELRL